MQAGGGRPVVAGVDGSECALQAVRWGAAEAVRRRRSLRLVAAHARPSGDGPSYRMRAHQARAEQLRQAVRQ